MSYTENLNFLFTQNTREIAILVTIGAATAYITLISKYLLRYLEKRSVNESYKQTFNVVKLTEEQEQNIIQKLNLKFVDTTSQGIIWEVYRKTEEKLKDFSETSISLNTFNKTCQRISEEVVFLTKRGNLNLTIGIVITTIGISLLGYYLFEKVSYKDGYDYLYHYIPRLSLVLLIEVFAYFFLKLYKQSLDDIKFFQNELTNIEAKMSAISLGFDKDSDKPQRIAIINELIKTDRNKNNLRIKPKENTINIEELIKSLGSIISKETKA